MKQLTCEMCGSTELLKQDGVFVCQTCGTKYSVEEARKMMVEGTVEVQGTVRVDNTDSVSKYLTNARRALMKDDWEEVEKYYNLVEQNSENNMEAVFFSSYGKAMLSLTDSDYFKRQQKFEVLNRSISVISDYYELTDEDREDVLNRINTYIKKMFVTTYVYEKQGLSVMGAMRSISAAIGSQQWCINLINTTKNTFVAELKQIANKHEDSFVKILINDYEHYEIHDEDIHVLTIKRKPLECGKIKVLIDGVREVVLGSDEEKTVQLAHGEHNLNVSSGAKCCSILVSLQQDTVVQVEQGFFKMKARII